MYSVCVCVSSGLSLHHVGPEGQTQVIRLQVFTESIFINQNRETS